MAPQFDPGVLSGILGGMASAYHQKNVTLLDAEINSRNAQAQMMESMIKDGHLPPETRQAAGEVWSAIRSTPYTKALPSFAGTGAMKYVLGQHPLTQASQQQQQQQQGQQGQQGQQQQQPAQQQSPTPPPPPTP